MISMSTLRVCGRLANAFTLDLIRLDGHRGDMVEALLLAAIEDANLAPLGRDCDLQRRYATEDADAPDDLRRPISINALATSLRLPPQTVHRRVAGLAATGACAVTLAGVIVPRTVTSSAKYQAALRAQYDGLQRLYGRLRAMGALDAPPAAEPWGSQPPVRIVRRLVLEYFLRFAELTVEHVGDPFRTLTLLEVIRINTGSWTDDEGGGAGVEPAAFVPDARRAPASSSAVAARLGVSDKTIGRHLTRLVEAGMCQRVSRGYIVPATALARPEVLTFAVRNYANVGRMFMTLAHLGVLEAWQDGPAGAGAASCETEERRVR
jgi:DNA-binding transcriptional ArsR family regulator